MTRESTDRVTSEGGVARIASMAGPAVVVAAALLGLEAIRVFSTYTVWLIGEASSREVLGLVALGGFLGTVFAWPLGRYVGVQRGRALALLLLATSACVVQVAPVPWVAFAGGLAGTLCFGWFVALVLSSVGSTAGIAMAVALAIDLTVRVSFHTVDAPFADGFVSTGIVVVAVATIVLGSRCGVLRMATHLPGWRSVWPMLGFGPGIALYMLLSGNIGQVAVGAALNFREAALILCAGTACGVVWTWLHSRAGRTVGSILLATSVLTAVLGFAVFDAGTAAAGLGVGMVSAAFPVVLSNVIPRSVHGRHDWASTAAATVGLLVFVVLLFVFYSFYGPDWVMRASIGIVVVLGLGGWVNARPVVPSPPVTKREAGHIVGLAMLVMLPGAMGAVMAGPPSADDRPSVDGIKVITYNIRQGFGTDGRFDLEAVAQTLEENQADVIALQEVGRGWVISGGIDTLAWLSQRLQMPYVYGANATDLWGNAVLSRFPVRSANYRFDDPGRTPRGVLEVEIDADGLTYTILNTHLDHEVDDVAAITRERQVERVLGVWAGRPHSMIVGDLNATSDEVSIRKLREAGFVDADHDGPPTFPASGLRIDYVMHTPDLDLVEVRRPSTSASDHEPVWAHFAP